MKRIIRNTTFFVVAVLILQFLSVWAGDQLPVFKSQKVMMKERDIDPSAFFYTESKEALAAEKKIREAIER